MIYKRKDLLGLKDLSSDELLFIVKTAETMKYILRQKSRKSPYLQGKSVITMFYEQSSRARLSFELAANYLSANVVDMLVVKDGVQTEPLADMGALLDQMGADYIIVRHPMAGSAHFMAKNTEASVINAGDGFNENPGQGLLDLLTIKEQKKEFEGLKVAVLGDIIHTRTGKSDIWGLVKLGADVRVAGPANLVVDEFSRFGISVHYDAEKAVEDADVVIALKVPKKQNAQEAATSTLEYRSRFCVNPKLLSYAKDDAIVMHSGPVNVGVEIAPEVAHSKQCIINDQMSNSIAVRMAMLYILS